MAGARRARLPMKPCAPLAVAASPKIGSFSALIRITRRPGTSAAPRRLVAVHAGQGQVDQRDVGAKPGRERARVLAAGSLADDQQGRLVAQQLPHERPEGGAVLDHEQAKCVRHGHKFTAGPGSCGDRLLDSSTRC